jgi:hypothetical protein
VAVAVGGMMPADSFAELALLDNEFVSVRRAAGSRIIRVTRTSTPIAALPEVEQAWGSVNRALLKLNRSEHALLIDMRSARGRNDDAFERAVAPHRAATVLGFGRVAVLVRSLHGQLQVKRHVREDSLGAVCVFDSEALALQWLAAAHGG